MKSEPNEYSIADLAYAKIGQWDGVRNYQVRNMMRDTMKVGDKAFFYHSNAGKDTGIVGEIKIIRAAYPDPTQFDSRHGHYDQRSSLENPRWLCVDVAHVHTYAHVLPLTTLRTDPQLKELALLRQGNRLSILPLTAAQFTYLRAQATQQKLKKCG